MKMILKKAKDRNTYFNDRVKTKFAIFPTKMRLHEDDTCGEWIWLEPYIQRKSYTSGPTILGRKKYRKRWRITSKLTPAEAFLLAIEKNASDPVEMQTGYAMKDYSGDKRANY